MTQLKLPPENPGRFTLLFVHKLSKTPAHVVDVFERVMTGVLDRRVVGKVSVNQFVDGNSLVAGIESAAF